jgi:hypothetical protein
MIPNARSDEALTGAHGPTIRTRSNKPGRDGLVGSVMRSTAGLPNDVAWPSLNDTDGRLLGLPFVIVGCAPGLLLSWSACLAALLVASVASFLIYVPMTALALNGGTAIKDDAPLPPLTPRAYVLLLLLWTATAWAAAVVASTLG